MANPGKMDLLAFLDQPVLMVLRRPLGWTGKMVNLEKMDSLVFRGCLVPLALKEPLACLVFQVLQGWMVWMANSEKTDHLGHQSR